MNPYTKKIVELHKIHKAIENCKGGGDVTPSQEDILDVLSRDSPVKPVGYAMYKGSGMYELIDTTNIKELKDILAYFDSLENKTRPITVLYNYDDYDKEIPQYGPLVQVSYSYYGTPYIDVVVVNGGKDTLEINGQTYMTLMQSD